jgi:hypothetical protein
MADKNLTAVAMSYGSASADSGLTKGTSGDTFYIHGIDDASKVGLFAQTTNKGTKLVISSTDVDYSGAGVGDLDITIAATSTSLGHCFVGPFDGTRFLVETSTGSYINIGVSATTGGVAGVSLAAFQL